ncbi:MAG: ABC transporter permease [Agathobacter sp.]|nr:ABC transporter permease [Agathobacter sp.]
MKNLRTLYRFELKKLLSRKIVWITVAAMLVLAGFTVCGRFLAGYYVDGERLDSNYGIFQKTRAAQRALSGRVIDQQLLKETWDAYGKIPTDAEVPYVGTEEYWEYAFPYSAVFNFVRATTGMTVSAAMDWKADEADLYRKRQDMLENYWDGYYLSEGEKEYWRQQELSVEKPFTYAYNEGWERLFVVFYTLGLMAQLTIAICLSNVFTIEQSRKTDQLILCSRNGKGTLYLAKLFAGIGFAAGISLLYTIAVFALSLAILGGEGFGAALQLIYPDCSLPLSVGQAVLIAYGLMLIASILTGIFTMVLSEILRNGIGTLSVIGGIILLSMFVNIPYHYRVLAQIWDYLPCSYLTIWNVLDCRLVPFFGTYLNGMQFVPILYLVTAGILWLAGYKIYQAYQVRAR